MSISRRQFLTHTGVTTLALLGFSSIANAYSAFLPLTNSGAPFTLPPLSYKYDALEPYIDTITMTIHYTKHHQAYITKLNEAVAKEPSLKDKTLEQLITGISQVPEAVRIVVRNNAGGHWNHTFFWNILTNKKDTHASDKLNTAIVAKWGTIDGFKQEFEKAGLSVFGSGWVWLIKKETGGLDIVTTHNQDNPRMDISEVKGTPLLGLDVWEHAYYLKYQNRRVDYLKAYWSVLNWEMVNTLFEG